MCVNSLLYYINANFRSILCVIIGIAHGISCIFDSVLIVNDINNVGPDLTVIFNKISTHSIRNLTNSMYNTFIYTI